MITAALIVYGYGDQRAWGDWTFEQLPSPGDLIALVDDLTSSHTLQVRHIEHFPASPARGIDRAPYSMVVADWKSEDVGSNT